MSSVGSSLTGGSGLDVQSTVDQLIYVERAPERLMQSQKSLMDTRSSTLQSIQGKLSALADSVFSLTDFLGPLNSVAAASSDASVLTASVTSAAVAATHTITVSHLATQSSWYSTATSNQSFTFSTGAKLSLQVGNGSAKQLVLEGKTLEQAADYINQSGAGVSATVVTDVNGSRLTLLSSATGKSGAITFSGNTTGLSWTCADPGSNGQLTVDGTPIEVSSNSVSGVIPGVTLKLSKESAGVPIALTIGPDFDEIITSINDFVSTYNDAISSLNDQFRFNSSTGQAGVLAGDTTLVNLQNALLSAMTRDVPAAGAVQSLRNLGIEMNDDGTLQVDSSQLEDSVKNNSADVRQFFQNASTGNSGFGIALSATLEEVNSEGGPVPADLKGVEQSSQSLQQQIDAFEVRIANRQQQLTDEYTRIDVMLRQFSALQQQISTQLGSLSTQ